MKKKIVFTASEKDIEKARSISLKILRPIFTIIFFCKYNLKLYCYKFYRYFLYLKILYYVLKFVFFSFLANRFNPYAVANDLHAYKRRIDWAYKVEEGSK